MNEHEIRLECLRLAAMFNDNADQTVVAAKAMMNFVFQIHERNEDPA